MARTEKKPVHHVQMTEGKRDIIRQLLQEYDIQSESDIPDALKNLLGGTIKEMMEAEMDEHLGYEKSQRSDSGDARNRYKQKQVNSSYGPVTIDVPQDRKSTFNPQNVKKRQKDISDIQARELIIVGSSHSCIGIVRELFPSPFEKLLKNTAPTCSRKIWRFPPWTSCRILAGNRLFPCAVR